MPVLTASAELLCVYSEFRPQLVQLESLFAYMQCSDNRQSAHFGFCFLHQL